MIKLTNDFEFCYPVLESKEKAFYEKVAELSDKNCILELRLDYLFFGGLKIDKIIDLVNRVNKDYPLLKIIATLRSKNEGGKYDFSVDEYYAYVTKLYENTQVSYIDIEYEYFKEKEFYYNQLLKDRNKKIIISKHVFDRTYGFEEYLDIFSEMTIEIADIVKFAINIPTKEELFTYMLAARESSEILKEASKGCIFIGMGKVGCLSRLWPEFTNTKIVFLTAYKSIDIELGQLNYVYYMKFRKLLAKSTKN